MHGSFKNRLPLVDFAFNPRFAAAPKDPFGESIIKSAERRVSRFPGALDAPR